MNQGGQRAGAGTAEPARPDNQREVPTARSAVRSALDAANHRAARRAPEAAGWACAAELGSCTRAGIRCRRLHYRRRADSWVLEAERAAQSTDHRVAAAVPGTRPAVVLREGRVAGRCCRIRGQLPRAAGRPPPGAQAVRLPGIHCRTHRQLSTVGCLSAGTRRGHHRIQPLAGAVVLCRCPVFGGCWCTRGQRSAVGCSSPGARGTQLPGIYHRIQRRAPSVPQRAVRPLPRRDQLVGQRFTR